MLKKPDGRILRVILIGILSVIGLLCLSLVIWRISVELDEKQCTARLAEEYHVEPTYTAIGNAILARVQAEAGPDMNRDDVLALMEKIAPVTVSKVTRFVFSDGKVKEEIFLKTCGSSWNGFDYFMISTSDGIVLDIFLYFND